jgi:hypothetical protein
MGAQESLNLICWLQQFTLVIQSSVKVSHAQFQTIKIIIQLLWQPTTAAITIKHNSNDGRKETTNNNIFRSIGRINFRLAAAAAARASPLSISIQINLQSAECVYYFPLPNLQTVLNLNDRQKWLWATQAESLSWLNFVFVHRLRAPAYNISAAPSSRQKARAREMMYAGAEMRSSISN